MINTKEITNDLAYEFLGHPGYRQCQDCKTVYAPIVALKASDACACCGSRNTKKVEA